VDVSEIGFEALAREMSQWDERFLMPTAVLAHISLHLRVAAAVAMFIAEASEDLSSGVPLLGRSGFVVDQDLVDDRLEWPEPGGPTVPCQRLGMRVRMHESMPHGPSRVSELTGDLPDGQTIAQGSPNRAIIIHGNHVLILRAGDRSM
jgi:hypothetical protein